MHTFEIRIQRRVDDTWPVVVEESEAGVLLPVRTEGGLSLALDDVGLYEPSECGTVLGKSLFQGAVGVAFEKALARSAEDLHVLLSVEDDRLRTLRWERLCRPAEGGWRPVALDQSVPFSRYLPSITDRRFPPIGRADLRLLIVAASPTDSEEYGLTPFDEARAVEAVTCALSGHIPADVLANVADATGPPTLDALCERLTAGGYTLLHLVCHGAFLNRERPTPAVPQGETVLYLCDAGGAVAPVTATELIRRLGLLRGGRGLPQLAFLSTCDSASPEAEWSLGGLGQRLVRELGMPAVVAMTDRITVGTALRLAGAFYSGLCEHGEVDRALTEAFAALMARPGVAVPVPTLFGRLGGRPLFGKTTEHALTPPEVAIGLDRMAELFHDRAPALVPELTSKAAAVRGSLGVDAAELAREARRERDDALETINGLCGEVLEMSFRALADGQRPPPYNAECPFRGLYPFRPEDRRFFFGREPFIDELASRIVEHPFLAVLGSSGSGKSSLVLAGLVHRLTDAGGHASRACRVITPGSKPDEALNSALDALSEASRERGSLLVVDQFEEVFTLCGEDARRAFFDRLLDHTPGCAVVLTMRADFWGDCATYKGLAATMLAHQVLLAPMDAAELRRSMERQAAAVNLRFETGLANALLDDVAGEPAAMPLLQHALLELWNRRRGRWLKAEAYEEIGRVRGAIARSAEALYEKLGEPDRRRVREIFLRLTRLGDDGSGSGLGRRDTRRRVPMAELVPGGGDPAATRSLVARLANHRLVVVDTEDRVEVGHEALIGHWPRLRGWLDEKPDLLRQRQEIGEAARDWEESGRSDDLLVHRGSRLLLAQTLLTGGLVEFNELESVYVEAGLALATRQAAQEEEQRRLELAQAQELAAARGRSARIFKRASIITGVLGLGAAVLGWWALRERSAAIEAGINEANQKTAALNAKTAAETNAHAAEIARDEADRQARIADAGRLGAQSQAALGQYPQRGVLLAAEAMNTTLRKGERPAPAAEQALRDALATVGGRGWGGGGVLIRHSRFTADSRRLVTVERDAVRIWDLAAPSAPPLTPLDRRPEDLGIVAFSPDGRRMVTGGRDRGLRVWDLPAEGTSARPPVLRATSRRDGPLGGQGFLTMSPEFSPDGRWLVYSEGKDQHLRLWDLEAPNPATLPFSFPSQGPEHLVAVDFSRDRRWLVIAGADNAARLSDLKAPDPVKATVVLPGSKNLTATTVFGPDSRWLLVGGNESARLWDLTRPRPAESSITLPGNKRTFLTASISPRGRWLVTAGDDEMGASVWDLSVPDPATKPITLPDHEDHVSLVAFSTDDRWLVTSGKVNALATAMGAESKHPNARLWDLKTSAPTARPVVLRAGAGVTALAIDPSSRWVITGHEDRAMRLWSLGAPDPAAGPVVLRGHEGAVLDMAFSPDGRWLRTEAWDGSARLWDLKSTESTADPLVLPDASLRLVDYNLWTHPAAFSPDSRWLVTWSGDARTVRLSDLTSPDPASGSITLPREGWAISRILISPDSRWLVTTRHNTVSRLWDLKAPGPPHPQALSEPTGVDGSLGFSPDSRWLISCRDYERRDARLWDLKAPVPGADPYLLRGHDKRILSLKFTNDSRWLISGGEDKVTRLWDLTSPNPAARPAVLPVQSANEWAVASGPDSQRLVTGGQDNTTRVWDLMASDPAARPVLLPDGRVNRLRVSPDGRWVVSDSTDRAADRRTRLWQIAGQNASTKPFLLHGRGGNLTAAGLAVEPSFSADSRWLATIDSEGNGLLWDLGTPDPTSRPRVLSDREGKITEIAFSLDCRWLYTREWDISRHVTTMRLWDLASTGTMPFILRGHEDQITASAVSPGSRHLITGSRDTTVRIWDLCDPNPANNPIVLRGHTKPIYHVAVSPDGRWLVTASEDWTVRLWSLGARDLLERSRVAVGRNLTLEEWQQYFPGQPYRPVFLDLPVPEYDEAYHRLERNLTPKEWEAYFPTQPYRAFFPNPTSTKSRMP